MKIIVSITKLRFPLRKLLSKILGFLLKNFLALYSCECPHDHCHYDFENLTPECSEDEPAHTNKGQNVGWCYQGNCGPKHWATMDKVLRLSTQFEVIYIIKGL